MADFPCSDDRENSYAYACEDSNGHWIVPNSISGAWSDGDAACANLIGDYHFSYPTNSQSNQALKLAKDASGYNTVWLNYDDIEKEGNWANVQLDN